MPGLSPGNQFFYFKLLLWLAHGVVSGSLEHQIKYFLTVNFHHIRPINHLKYGFVFRHCPLYGCPVNKFSPVDFLEFLMVVNMLNTIVIWLAQMDEMIAGIREVFVSNLKDLAWMDDETRKAAEEKVRFV